MRLKHASPYRAFSVAASAVICVLCVTSLARAQKCTGIDPQHPPNTQYRVRAVRIESQLDFVHAISNYLKELKAKLPVKEKQIYPLPQIINDISEGREIIERKLDKAQKDEDPRSRIRIVLGGFENCQDATNPPELDVVYRIFLTNYDDYLSHTFELKDKELQEPSHSAAEPKAEGRVTIQPLGGFNSTRNLFGGGLLRLDLPVSPFQTVELSADGSNNSNIEKFELAGSRSFGLAALNYLDYRLSYTHSDVPGNDNQLRHGTLSLQAFGSSGSLGKRRILLRYGASLEGGNQQTDVVAAANATQSVAASGYGALKAYVGATLKLKRVSLSGTYGLQLGTQGANSDLGFTKHLGNLFLTAQPFKKRLKPNQILANKPGEVHKTLTIDARFAAGAIQNLGQIPVVERFFGGNAKKDFIEGDTWKIVSGPYIRSIPENRLNSSALTENIGGTRFYSVNLTVSREIWGYPMIPKEIAGDPDFASALNASKNNARRIMRNTYLRKVPAYADFARALPRTTMPPSHITLQQWLTNLADTVSGLITGETVLPGLSEDQREEISNRADEVQGLAIIIASKFEDTDKLPATLQEIMVERDSLHCFKSDDDNECSLLTTLRLKQKNLADLLNLVGMSETAKTMMVDLELLRQKQSELVIAVNAIDTSLADSLADSDMKAISVPLDAFVNDLNVVAVSPVAVFDSARVWPSDFGVRYGIGGGVRLSLLTLNMTTGYAFNVKREPKEPRGAFFFSVDFLDIFR